MKDYLIWLESGNCIEGTISNETAANLKVVFSENSQKDRMIGFNDNDGEIMVRRRSIVAIGLNNQYRTVKVKGFR